MKNINLLITALILSTLLFSCDNSNEDDPSPEENAQDLIVEALQGTWTAVEARKENTVITDFSNFSVTVSDKTYSTQNGAPVWPSSGSFDFENIETEDQFIRQDGRLFTARVNNNNLNIVIVYQEELARGEYGTYEFTLSK